MGAVIRGVRNAFRNNVRTFSIVLILALSIAMALVMLLSLKTIQSKITSVKSSIGNTITVSPAGVRGFEGSGTLLTDQNASDIESLPHVSSVTKILTSRLTTIGSDTASFFGRNETSNSSNNQTSLSAPPMERPANDSGSRDNSDRHFVVNGQDVTGQSFSIPISVTGINNLSDLSALNATSFSLTSGGKIDPTSSENVAMLGKALAEQNSIAVGQTFTAFDTEITVKGIFDAGNTFANAVIIMPITTLQNLASESGQLNSIIVTTDSVDSLSSVQTAITDKLGSSVDVTSSQETAEEAITPLENIKTISLYSLIGSLVAGSIIIFLAMVMIVRERRREIGVLKAIGSSNVNVVTQFVSESLVLTLMGSFVGMILGLIFSNPVLNVLVNNSSSSSTASQTVRQFGQGVGRAAFARIGSGIDSARNTLENLHTVVGWDIVLYGLLAAIIIAIIGSAIPALLIAKIRPAEVMRTE